MVDAVLSLVVDTAGFEYSEFASVADLFAVAYAIDSFGSLTHLNIDFLPLDMDMQ